MKQIKELVKIPAPQKGPRSEREELLTIILEEINLERKGTEFKPMKGKVLAIKLSHIPTKDLHYFINQARDYQVRHGSFSKYIFGSIKAR